MPKTPKNAFKYDPIKGICWCINCGDIAYWAEEKEWPTFGDGRAKDKFKAMHRTTS